MRKIEIPEWFKSLPMDANLNAMDIKHLFSYSQKTEIAQLISDRSLPEPCWYGKSLKGGKGLPMWRKRNLVKAMMGN